MKLFYQPDKKVRSLKNPLFIDLLAVSVMLNLYGGENVKSLFI